LKKGYSFCHHIRFLKKREQAMHVFHFGRQALGLSQEELARLLGLGLPLLKLAETNRRDIPSDSLNRLAWIYQTIQNNSPEAEAPDFPSRNVDDVLQQCRAKLRKLKSEITNRQKKNRQMALRLAVKPKFLMQFPESAFPQVHSQFLALDLEAEAYEQGEEKDALVLLMARKAGLQASISFLKNQQKKR
jgi:transcriptional regulator with XRE-family HTH domain